MAAITVLSVGQKITRQALPTTELAIPVTVDPMAKRATIAIICDTAFRYHSESSQVVADGAPFGASPSQPLVITVLDGKPFYLCAQSVAGNVHFVVLSIG